MILDCYRNGLIVLMHTTLNRILLSLVLSIAGLAGPALAQQAGAVPRVGTVAGTTAGTTVGTTTAQYAAETRRKAVEVMPVDEVAVLVIAGEETTLSAQMAGRIHRVHVGLGESIKAGTLLMEFDCAEQQAQLRSAEAEYRGARETHLTKLKLQALGAAGELEVTVAASVADKSRSQVELRESQLLYCRVLAPFPGQVARLRVKAAESVSLGNPLVELVNTASLKSQMFVPATYLRNLGVGSLFQVRLEDGRKFRARVSRLNSRVEGVSQQLEIEGRFEGPTEGLLPGMVGTAEFLPRGRAQRQ